MANVFDYLKWRDDIPLNEINEVDVLIFNRLAYFPWEKLITDEKHMSINEAYAKSENLKLKFSAQDLALFKILAHSHRYQNLMISNVVSKIDLKKEEQFFAITIHLPKNYLYLSFRGTTNDIVGWKENLNMSFMTVFAQLDALDYLNKTNLSKKIYLGGHSKGGNLAMYALIHANKFARSRIVKVFNYDGPGFLELSPNYYSVKDKIVSYIPNNSVVGRLLQQDHLTKVIQSDKIGLGGHNLYSWQIEKDHLITSQLTQESDFIKKTVDEFLIKVSKINREKLIEDLYDIILKTNAKSIKDINFSKLKDIILSYRSLDNESRELLYTIIKSLYYSTKDNLTNQNINIK